MKTYCLSAFMILSLISPPQVFADADIEKGKGIYAARCASCHGPAGAGDGPVAAALPAGQKPASFLDGKFKKVTDDKSFVELLDKGGSAMGLSPLMAAQPGMTAEDKANVIAFVHSLKK